MVEYRIFWLGKDYHSCSLFRPFDASTKCSK